MLGTQFTLGCTLAQGIVAKVFVDGVDVVPQQAMRGPSPPSHCMLLFLCAIHMLVPGTRVSADSSQPTRLYTHTVHIAGVFSIVGIEH